MRRRNSEDPSQCNEARGTSCGLVDTAPVLMLGGIVAVPIALEAATSRLYKVFELDSSSIHAQLGEVVYTLFYQYVEVRDL